MSSDRSTTSAAEQAVTSRAAAPMEVLALDAAPEVFQELATSMGEVPVFAVRDLPKGSSVAERWWPVVENESLSEVTQTQANPWLVDAADPEPEAQLLLSYGQGWVLLLQNFRGDLGDVVGRVVGTVAGQPASLYEVNGGCLVQWGYQGRWYGVFGRGVPEETVISVALEMILLERH